MDTVEVKVFLQLASQPLVYEALTTYEKGSFYCVVYIDQQGSTQVRRFPLASLFAVEEEYRYIGWTPTAQMKQEEA